MMQPNDRTDQAAFLDWAQQRAVSAWGLTLDARLYGGYSGARLYACVDHAGAQLVLKLSPPDQAGDGLARSAKSELEATALRAWHRHGAGSAAWSQG